MSVIVIGLDPGESCGLAVIKDGKKFSVIQSTPDVAVEFAATMITGWSSFPSVNLSVCCERYTITKRSGMMGSSQNVPLKITGAIENECDKHDVPFHAQDIATAKRMFSNTMLKKLNLYVTPGEVNRSDADDANDAMRQAMLGIARHHAVLFDEMARYSREESIGYYSW